MNTRMELNNTTGIRYYGHPDECIINTGLFYWANIPVPEPYQAPDEHARLVYRPIGRWVIDRLIDCGPLDHPILAYEGAL